MCRESAYPATRTVGVAHESIMHKQSVRRVTSKTTAGDVKRDNNRQD